MWQMSVKWLGAALLFLACGAAGWGKGEQLTRRVRLLEDMIVVLNHLHDSLRFEIGSTYELLRQTADQVLLRELHLSFSDLNDGPSLEEELKEQLKHLQEHCKNLVYDHEFHYFESGLLGLMRLPAEQEERLLEYSASQLSLLVRNARQECIQQRKLYRVMGFSFGGMAALLLL